MIEKSRTSKNLSHVYCKIIIKNIAQRGKCKLLGFSFQTMLLGLGTVGRIDGVIAS
jgi:hypothetical protein